MSTKELRRVSVLGRVAAGTLSLREAATVLSVSYRQVKRLAQRYRAEGAAGLKHRSAGRASNRATPAAERARVLAVVREKYSGDAATRFGPTLAAEHLATEDGIRVHHETLRRRLLGRGSGAGRANAVRIGSAASASRTLASWCSSTGVSIAGSKTEGPPAAY
jgi:transposase